MTKNLGKLTSPGTFEELSISQYDTHLFSLVVDNLNDYVGVRIEYSFDRVIWSNLDIDDLYLDENDSYNLLVTPDFPVDFLRLNWFEEGGGTDAEIQLYYKGVN